MNEKWEKPIIILVFLFLILTMILAIISLFSKKNISGFISISLGIAFLFLSIRSYVIYCQNKITNNLLVVLMYLLIFIVNMMLGINRVISFYS